MFKKVKKRFHISQKVENFSKKYTKCDKHFNKKKVYFTKRKSLRGGKDVSKYNGRRKRRSFYTRRN